MRQLSERKQWLIIAVVVICCVCVTLDKMLEPVSVVQSSGQPKQERRVMKFVKWMLEKD